MEETMKAFYDEIAKGYDREQEEFGFVRIPEREIVMDAIDKVARKDWSVLEIGAGTGRFTLEIAPLVKRITAIDVSPKMLDCLSQKLTDRGVTNIRQMCGDFMETTFDEKYDLIVGFSAIEYIKDKQALFAKISNLLAPGGHLIITTSHNTFFRWWGRMGNYFRQGILMAAYRKGELHQLLKINGLTMIELTDLCLKSHFSKGILLFAHAAKKF
jgi:ubiquinone/menaquinone biosynthesis C-methylase UbiE